MSNDAPSAVERPPRPDSDDTIFIGNLPADTTRMSLLKWCEDNFTSCPGSVSVQKPRRPRDGGEAPNVRFGFLRFEDASLAAATLSLLCDPNDPFTFNETVVEAKWAKVRRERAPRADADAEGGEEGGAAKKKKRRPRKKKVKADDDVDSGAAPADDGEGSSERTGRKRKPRRRRKKAPASTENTEPEPADDMTGRVYCKNFGTEEELQALLAQHGTVASLEVKEVRRGPGAGQIYAFATFEDQANADAAVTALSPEGEEVIEGALVLALARPKVSRTRARRSGPASTSIRLEEPSTLDLCCRNLPYSMDDTALKALFEEFPSVESARIITRGGRSRGYGFVHFGEAGDAASAQIALSGRELGTGANDEPLNLKLDFALSAPRPILDEAGAAAAAAAGQAVASEN